MLETFRAVIRRLAANRRALLVAAVLVFVGANLLIAHGLVATRERTTRLRADRATVRAQRKAREHDLYQRITELNAALEELGARTAARDTFRQQGSERRAVAVAAGADLVVTFGRLGTEGSRVSSLTTCLQGVSEALNALAVGDTRPGLERLRAVDGACRAGRA